MYLRSLAIKNYRSLEEIRLDNLNRFNVLIGRNNSGKSSVFGALQLLSNRVLQGTINMDRVLTDLDLSRSLEITLMFEVRSQDRRDFIDSLRIPHNDRREDMLDSPLLRHVEYHFEAPPGQPELLNLQETRVRTEDGRWATTQRRTGDLTTENAESTMVQIDFIRSIENPIPLNSTVLDVDTANQVKDLSTVGVDVRSEMYNYAQSSQTNLPATLWLQRRLVKYLGGGFFFDPFRHSEGSWATEAMPDLAQDGSNLAQVLSR
jgi:hypothetical protein